MDKKISQLTALTGANVAADDVLAIVDTNATETKKIRADELFKSLSAGTALLPAIAPAADQNTGIFFPAADTIAFAEGGVESMRINSSGNLGLGVTPSAWGSGLKALQVGSNSYGSLFDFNNGVTTLSSNLFWTGSAYSRISSSSRWALSYFQDTTNGAHSWWVSTDAGTGNVTLSESMRITSAGNVCIGNTNPLALYLDVGDAVSTSTMDSNGSGQFRIRGGTQALAFAIESANLATIYTNSSSGALAFGTNDTERLRIASAGNVGIGTSSPGANLDVVNTLRLTGNDASIVSGQTVGEIQFYSIDVDGPHVAGFIRAIGDETFGRKDALTFGVSQTNNTDATEAMRIDSAGNVGIGVTPSAWNSGVKALQITSALSLFGNGSNNATIGNNWYLNSSDQFIYNSSLTASYYRQASGAHSWHTAPSGTAGNVITFSESMRIASDGIVTMNAYGAGAATFSAAGVISSVSDETWKNKDGVPVDPDAMLKMLEPGYWYYNDEKAPTFGSDRQLGFYAQNVNAAIGPEAAPVPEEGKPWGYYDRSVLAVAVMSLKNALSTIEELKERIATLENK